MPELSPFSGEGKAEKNTINEYGAIILSSGAVAADTEINADGGLHIYDGAAAYTTRVKYDAALGVGLGGKVCNVEIDYGAAVTFYGGALAEGKIDLKGSAVVLENLDLANAYLNFDISDTGWTEGVLLNSIAGCTDGVLSIEVDAQGQNRGRYAIAGNADGFNRGVTLWAGTNNAGTLQAGGPAIQIGNTFYALNVADNTLFLDVAYVSQSADVLLYQLIGGQGHLTGSAAAMNNVTVVSGQLLEAARGGSLSAVTVDGGVLRLLEGAFAQNVAFNSGEVSLNHGFIDTITVNAGYLIVDNGGGVRNIDAKGGIICVKNESIVRQNLLSAAYIEVSDGASAIGTTAYAQTAVHANAGGEVIDTIVSSGAVLYANDQGTCQKAEIFSDAILAVSSGGHCENVLIQQGGSANIFAGASVADLVCAGSHVRLMIGIDGSTNVQYVSGGKSYEIREGAMVGATIDVNTYINLYSGGVVSRLYTTGCVEPVGRGSGGVLQIYSGGSAYDIEHHTSAQVNVFSGGYLSGVFAESDAEVYLSGGFAENIEVGSSGYIWVHSNGVASNVRMNDYAGFTVSNGGSAHNVEIFGGIAMIEESSARLTNASVQRNGILHICGATASNIEVSSGGIMAFTSQFQVMDGPVRQAYNGQGYDISVGNSGTLSVRQTGSATRVSLSSGAGLQVGDLSEVLDLHAHDGSYAIVSAGGRVTRGNIDSGARVEIETGTACTGLNIADGANVFLQFSQGTNFSGTCCGSSFTTTGNTLSN